MKPKKDSYTRPKDPIRLIPKPDPDMKPIKRKYFFNSRRDNFWNLFEEKE